MIVTTTERMTVFDILKENGLTTCTDKKSFECELENLMKSSNTPLTEGPLKRKLGLVINPIVQTSMEMTRYINNHPHDYEGLVQFLKEIIGKNMEDMARPSNSTFTYSNENSSKTSLNNKKENVPPQPQPSQPNKKETSTNKTPDEKPKITNHLGFQTVIRNTDQEQDDTNHEQAKKEFTIEISSHCKLAQESISFLSDMKHDELIDLFKEVMNHQKGLFKKQYLKHFFGKIIVADRNERKFYQKALQQDIVPSRYYTVTVSCPIEMGMIDSYILTSVQFKNDFKITETITVKGQSDIFYFCNYFRYLYNKKKNITKFQYILPNFIDDGLKKVQQEMFGMEHHVGLMTTEVRMLSSLNIPRGFLFWGPPGTGKTTVAKKLCDYWTIKQVCDSLASGDFKQGYQGDSEKMIRHLGERASAIPWILTAVIIDEIDALAQSREGGHHGEKGDVNMISILLSMIGGMNDVPNLIFFGSTNLYQTMDEAFLRRMDGKFFIGKPSFSAREKWIQCYTDETIMTIKDERGLEKEVKIPPKIVLEPSCRKQTVENMQILTINFSHDAMLKLLTKMQVNYKEDFKDLLVDGISIENIVDYISHICKMNKIYFGRYILTELAPGLKKLNDTNNTIERYSSIQPFLEASKGQREGGCAYTGKILVDLTDNSKSFGLEYGFFLSQEEIGVEQVLDSISHSPRDFETLFKLNVIKENEYKILMRETEAVMNLKLNSNTIKNAQPKFIIEIYLNLKRETFKNYLLENCDDNLSCTENAVENIQRCTERFIKEYKNQLSNKRPLKQTKAQYITLSYKNNEDKSTNGLSLEEALTILLKFGVQGNFDAVYYIDANTLYANNLLSEDRIMQYIESLNSECNEYHRSMIIFDLDSIAELKRNYSGFKDQFDALEIYEKKSLNSTSSDNSSDSFHTPTFNYSMMRPQVITRIIRLLTNTKYTENGPKIWYTAISSDKYMINMIKREVKWPEDDEEEMERTKLEELHKIRLCKNCSKEFTHHNNTDESCCYHSLNKLYFEQDRRFMEEYDQKHKKEALAKITNDLERKKYINKNRNSIFSLIETYTKEQIEEMIEKRMDDVNVNEVRWVCCGRGFNEEGEHVCKHEEFQLIQPTITTTKDSPTSGIPTSIPKSPSKDSSFTIPSFFSNNTNINTNINTNNKNNLSNISLGKGNLSTNNNTTQPSLFSKTPISVTGMDNLCVKCKIGTRHREHGVLLPYCSNFCASRDMCIHCKMKPKYFDMSSGTLHQFCGENCKQRYN